MAILRAASGLGRKDPLDLDVGPAPGQPYLVGECGQGGDPLVGELGQGGQFSSGQEAALVEQGPLGGGDEHAAVDDNHLPSSALRISSTRSERS